MRQTFSRVRWSMQGSPVNTPHRSHGPNRVHGVMAIRAM
jgi:hypothetical protein